MEPATREVSLRESALVLAGSPQEGDNKGASMTVEYESEDI